MVVMDLSRIIAETKEIQGETREDSHTSTISTIISWRGVGGGGGPRFFGEQQPRLHLALKIGLPCEYVAVPVVRHKFI